MFQEAGFLQGDVWLWCVSVWRLCVTSVCLSASVFMLVSIYISLAVENRYLLVIAQVTREFNVRHRNLSHLGKEKHLDLV